MKKLIFTVSMLVLSLTANASYFQEQCSDAARTVSVSMGHSKNQVVLTERVDGEEGSGVKAVVFVNNEVIVNNVESRELERKSKKFCDKEQSGGGYGTMRRLDYQKAVIQKRDGSSFSKDIIGVSEDGKSVSASLLCEFNSNSRIACP